MSEFAFADGVASPRKHPAQDRSRQTVSAILEATFRVLDDAGADGLTTTRVAEVAGVSVGTLYQYFPNRDALINALLADHLDAAIVAVERACEASAALPLEAAVELVVRAFLAEKAARADSSRILNKAFGVGMLDDRPLVRAGAKRAHAAVTTVLARTLPADEANRRAEIACNALEGMVRGTLEDPTQLGDPATIDRIVAIAVAALR